MASLSQGHAGLIRWPPAINQQEQCILGGGGNSCLKMEEVLSPLLAYLQRLTKTPDSINDAVFDARWE